MSEPKTKSALARHGQGVLSGRPPAPLTGIRPEVIRGTGADPGLPDVHEIGALQVVIDQALANLNDVINNLADRIDIVLEPPGPAAQPPTSRDSVTALGNWLGTVFDCLGRANEALSNIQERVRL
jgi:hypothetical protein